MTDRRGGRGTMSEAMTDTRARREALDTSRSFVVQAPAGSGKTELLMQRFLALLALSERPEQVLAITFTRKAAGEMQNRIVEALRKASGGFKPEAPHEQTTITLAGKVLDRSSALGWEILDNPGRLRIQTIDSLSAELVRLTPLLSRLGRPGSITENPEELYREAAERTVETVEEDSADGEAVRKALAHLDNSVKGFMDRVAGMLERRDQWHRHVERRDEAELREVCESSLRSIVEMELASIQRAAPDGFIERLAPIARYAAANLARAGRDSAITQLVSLDGLPGALSDDLPLWKGIRELLLTGDNGARKPGGVDVRLGFSNDKTTEAMAPKEAFKAMLEELAGYPAFVQELSKAQKLPRPVFENHDWEILDALLRVLPIAQRHLDAVFAARGEVDYMAVSMAALDSLGSELDPTNLMLSLDLRVQHILVDEYQDTSQAQLSLLKAMTCGWVPEDGRTLFLVGDPMQSIYLFREAQVGLFLDAVKSGVGVVKPDFLRLETNFRSTGGIVSWVNDTFGIAFPIIEDSFTGSIRYSPSVAVKKGAEAPAVSVSLYSGRDDEAEAAGVVEIIRNIPDGETAAVLCRSRSHADGIVEALKAGGISFRAQDMDSLGGRPVISDLMSLLRAMAHPYDRVAWLSVLRAPWCGLSLSDLHALCVCDAESPLARLMKDPERVARLSADGQERLLRASARLDAALSRWGRAGVRGLVEGLWIALGGPACVEDEPSMRDAEAFFGLLDPLGSLCSQADIRSVEERLEKLYADHGGTSETRLDVMTIHRSKGLEFDHVIIPGLGRRPGSDKGKLLLWMEREDGLLLAPIAKQGEKDKEDRKKATVYKYLSSVNSDKAAFELSRLFYVAATRARERLYLFGHMEPGKDGPRADGRSMLAVIEGSPSIDASSLIAAAAEQAPDNAGGAATAACPPLKRLPLAWRMPEAAEAVGAGEKPEQAAREAPEFHWAGEVRRHVGTVVHSLLCRIARQGLGGWDAARLKAARGAIETEFRTLGLGAAAAQAAAREATGIISRALSDDRGRWALSAHEKGFVEMEVTGFVDGRIVHVAIDRTFVENGVRWVVDYKSSSHEGGSLDDFLANERERYAGQLERYAAILRAGGEALEIRKGLYYPALGAWIEV